MLKNIGKFIVENIDKDEKEIVKLFNEQYISIIREGLDADIRRQLEEEDEEDIDNTDDLAGDILGGEETPENEISDEPIEKSEEETDRIKVKTLVINTDEVTLNKENTDEETEDNLENGEEISAEPSISDETDEISDEISDDLLEDEETEYENLLNEEDDEIDMDMTDGETVDIPMNVTDDDTEQDMLSDETLTDTMVVDADNIEINTKSVKTDDDFEEESFEDEFNNEETIASDDGEDYFNVENVEDGDEIAEKCRLNKKPIKEEEESEVELMNTFEQHLNSQDSGSGSNLRQSNPEEFAKKYSEWVKDVKGE